MLCLVSKGYYLHVSNLAIHRALKNVHIYYLPRKWLNGLEKTFILYQLFDDVRILSFSLHFLKFHSLSPSISISINVLHSIFLVLKDKKDKRSYLPLWFYLSFVLFIYFVYMLRLLLFLRILDVLSLFFFCLVCAWCFLSDILFLFLSQSRLRIRLLSNCLLNV